MRRAKRSEMRRTARGMALVGALALVAGCAGGGNGATGDIDADRAQEMVAERPSLMVIATSSTFVDPTRPTEAVGTAPATDDRTLETAVVFPAPGQPGAPYPLIVFGHGSGGRGRSDHPLLRAWAAAGYVVASPTFPFGGGRAGGGDSAADYVNQPADMSFVIDQVVRLGGDPSSPLSGLVDAERIGAAGHSLGGMTTLALAGNTCCHDARVKAAAVLAGRELPFRSGQFWARLRTPVLFVHGDADDAVPYADGRRAYADAPPPRFLVTIEGGDHGRPFSGDVSDPGARVVTATTLDFFDHYLKGSAGRLGQLGRDATVAGVARVEQEI